MLSSLECHQASRVYRNKAPVRRESIISRACVLAAYSASSRVLMQSQSNSLENYELFPLMMEAV